MKYKKIIRTLALTLFSSLFLLSAAVVISYLGESRAQEAAFDELEELAAEVETSSAPSSTVDSDTGEAGSPAMLPGYAALYAENPDLFGWVQIPDTELSYLPASFSWSGTGPADCTD